MKLKNLTVFIAILSLLSIFLLSFPSIYSKLNVFEISSTTPSTADVVIAGAGSGGISAAIQAARMGSKVVLLEETDYIGGQTTAAGVTSMDGNQEWQYGIYLEFINKIKSYYQNLGKPIDTCYWGPNNICFEPHVGKQILSQMIAAEPNITLITSTTISQVEIIDSHINSITTSLGNKISTNIVIDATEYGDIIMMTEPNYRIGNGTKQNPSPNACLQDITYLAVIKKYPDGLPNNLKIMTAPPGYTTALKSLFQNTISPNGTSVFNNTYPVNVTVHNGYRAMPDSNGPNYNFQHPELITKTGVNWANDYPRNSYIPSPEVYLSTNYLTDKNYRQQINCEAKLRTINFLYYLQTEMGQTNWSVATEEQYDTPYNKNINNCQNIPAELKTLESYLPPIPYVREGARGIGLTTITASDIKRIGSTPVSQKQFPTSIAIGDYPNDLHNCRNNDQLELSLESRADISGSGPFQVPIEALISPTTKGLIFAEKNISQTRLVNGATRLQPITMLTGQAAGALASLSSKNKVLPENLDYTLVQQELLRAGSPIFPFLDARPGTSGFVAIQTLAGLGIMGSTSPTTFSPNDNISRSQAAIYLLKSKHGSAYIPPTTSTPHFNDVSTGNPSFNWIEQFRLEGITNGCGNSNFCPDATLTRAEFAILLLKTMLGNAYTPPAPKGIFSDVPINSLGAAWIEDLKNRNLTSGCGTNIFCPTSPITRVQVAIFLKNGFPNLSSKTINISPTTLALDINQDGKINIEDYDTLVANFGNPYTIQDFNLLISHYGEISY